MIADLSATLSEKLFQTVFEKSPGSLLVRADGPCFTIAAVSDSYLQVTSVKRADIIGKSFFEVFPDNEDDPDDDTTARKVFTKVACTGQQIDIPVYRYDILGADGKREAHYWSCSNTPIAGANGAVEYILNTIIDITGEVKAKEEAIENESRLRMAADATGFGTWDLCLTDQSFQGSPRLNEIFGHNAGKPIPLQELRDQVHPDDMEHIVLPAFQLALKTGYYSYEVRIFWPDDSLHWIKTQARVLYDDGRPVRILGAMLDITESKRDDIRKNDFIAMASHELKTPLTSLKAYIQLLQVKAEKLPDSFFATTLGKAHNQVNKMTALIHGFLDLSKLEPGKLQIRPEPFDIMQLIAEVVADVSISYPTHPVLAESGQALVVDADKEKIGQVFHNLLSNGIKYSAKGSPIRITAKTVDQHIQVAVADQGIGIKKKDQEKLFQRFYRVDNAQMKNISGFGIGLYLAAEIIQRHKGNIWVESEPGIGSTFYFTLPAKVTATVA